MKKYRHVAIGGTFDRLHRGQKNLIDKAFKLGEKITIGLANAKLSQGKLLSQTIQPYSTRKKILEDYISSKKNSHRGSIIELNDIHGPAAIDATFDAIVITPETYDNAVKINKRRQESNLQPLKIVAAPLIKGEDTKIIRSERIRMGEIDSEGNSYLKLFTTKKTLTLPRYLRSKLRKPLGLIYNSTPKIIDYLNTINPVVIISTGDVITKALLQENVIPSVQIIDHRKQRQDIPAKNRILELARALRAKNAAGTISQSAVLALYKGINLYFAKKQPQQVVIEGEEDLLALPAILLSPLGSIVLYGQPNEGVVAITIDESLKKTICQLLEKFNY